MATTRELSESSPGKPDSSGIRPHSTEQAEPQALTASTEAEGHKRVACPVPVKDTGFFRYSFQVCLRVKPACSHHCIGKLGVCLRDSPEGGTFNRTHSQFLLKQSSNVPSNGPKMLINTHHQIVKTSMTQAGISDDPVRNKARSTLQN